MPNPNANYLSQHSSKVQNRIPIMPNYFEKGMVGEIYYMKEVDGKKQLNRYMIIVLQPFWRGKLHALKLSLISPQMLTSIVKPYGLMYSKRMKQIRKAKLPKVIMDESSQMFYNNEIKNILGTKLNGSYRTFTISNIKTSAVLDYRFSKDVILHEEYE